MHPFFLKEGKPYSRSELSGLLKLDSTSFASFIEKATDIGVIKKKPKSQGFNSLDMSEEFNNPYREISYSFHFVGVLYFDYKLIILYPKYYTSPPTDAIEFRPLLLALSKYNKDPKTYVKIRGANDTSGGISSITTLIYILSDYLQNGAYVSTDMQTNNEGQGMILWDKTINESAPYIQRGKPIYTELYSRHLANDDDNFFTRLHKSIVSECTQKLKDYGLLDLFDLTPCTPSEEEVDSLGDNDYLQCKLVNELGQVYDSRNILLLRTMLAYVRKHENNDYDTGERLELYGTTSYNLVWEHMCAEVFGSERDIPLKDNTHIRSSASKNLKEVIKKPIWSGYDSNREISFSHNADMGLIPDIVRFYKRDEVLGMAILDAKYYCIELDQSGIRNQPGVGDVAKQHLYHLAYQELHGELGVQEVINCFLFPGEEENIECIGEAYMSILRGIGLEKILLFRIPARLINELYLKGIKLNITDLLDSVHGIKYAV